MPVNTYQSGWNRIASNLDAGGHCDVAEQLFNSIVTHHHDDQNISDKANKFTKFSVSIPNENTTDTDKAIAPPVSKNEFIELNKY